MKCGQRYDRVDKPPPTHAAPLSEYLAQFGTCEMPDGTITLTPELREEMNKNSIISGRASASANQPVPAVPSMPVTGNLVQQKDRYIAAAKAAQLLLATGHGHHALRLQSQVIADRTKHHMETLGSVPEVPSKRGRRNRQALSSPSSEVSGTSLDSSEWEHLQPTPEVNIIEGLPINLPHYGQPGNPLTDSKELTELN